MAVDGALLVMDKEMVTKPPLLWGTGSLGQETCDVCRREVDAVFLTMHPIVPEDIAKEDTVPASQTARLCTSCGDRLHTWFLNRVTTVTYDWGLKRFKSKSPAEMVKEYEVAYKAFIKYERRRQKIG